MASEKTPNLGLNQIDRTSPKTTYFDLEKYLDENWRSVDKFAGDVNDGVNEIKKRLNTTERKAVTLEPGVQIVHAEKAAPFSLTGISGRMLVNLLGRAGSCDRIDSLLGWEADLAVDTSNKAQGTGSIKVTAKNASGVYNVYSTGLKLTGGRYYIALADVKNINASNNIYVNFSTGGNKALKQSKDQSRFVTIYTKCAPTNDTAINLEVASISTATGQTFYADAIRLYEISASDYAALDSMTAEQVVTKYPYVDSIMPVRNPYAIRYGENMLPSLFEWSAKQGTPIIVDEKSITVTLDNKIVHTVSPLVPGQKYTVSVQSGGATGRVTVTDDPESAIIVEAVGSGLLSATFTATSRAANIRLLGTSSTAVTMTKPMLNMGSTAKAFKPREDSMLALQTDLYADPVIGVNADTVFERDGQYFKVKRFESVLLDGSKITKVNNVVSGTGFKALYPVVPDVNYAFVGSGSAVKFDGKILLWGGQDTTADRWGIDATSPNFAISVSVSDSGWADSYPPTLDDIRAYFFGYKAYDANTLTPAQAQAATTATWNGTGTKYWVQRVGAPNFTQSVPQQSYAGYTPYQLVFQLATPTVEPIVSEGQLSFVEGDNQVEVGTGMIVREESKPSISSNQYWINGALGGLGKLRERPNKIFVVYKNSKNDRWGTITHADADKSTYGLVQAYAPAAKFDPSASYSTTYTTTEASPVVPFVGTYAANETTLLVDLVDSVQQNTARVSVLENKKAEKDNPAWLKPTLINGWASSLFGFIKLSDNVVYFRDSISGGITTPGTILFTLPPQYRPAIRTEIRVRSNGGGNESSNSTVVINTNGNVLIQNTIYTAVWLDGVSFIAEQ
ncbi:hypothetical protein DBL67_10600 [Paenibacillus polymyxa]|uniref:hypothetical protein n=1 Tax=Paenibacillus polymyxa TaxID=1406 RepID=UPI000D31A914|nr:hypothetical protein [Paenibacillus polymyxa]PTU47062.1 hypothetical protein DBL67_10600 [Paenibacillus polymyxa]